MGGASSNDPAIHAAGGLLQFPKDAVGFNESFFAPDIKPDPRDAVSVDRNPRIEPLDEAARLIGIVPFGDVGRKLRDGFLGEIVKGDPRVGALGMSRLLFEMRDHPVGVHLDAVVFLDGLKVFHVVGGQDGGAALCEAGEPFQGLAEKIVSGDDNQIGVPQVLAGNDQIDITDGSELVGIVLGAVIDDLEVQLRLAAGVFVSPGLEIGGELVVGHHENILDLRNGRQIIDYPFDHRFAGDIEQGLGFG